MPEPRDRRALISYGTLIGVTYAALMVLDLAQRAPQMDGAALVAVCLLTFSLTVGGGSLLLYALARRRTHFVATLRSLGVAASLGALLGTLVLTTSLVTGSASGAALATPIYGVEVALSLCLLWLWTFPITSPTARRVVSGTLLGLCLLAPLAITWALRGHPLQPWIAAMSLGWLLVLLAQSRLRDKTLDPPAAPVSTGGGHALRPSA